MLKSKYEETHLLKVLRKLPNESLTHIHTRKIKREKTTYPSKRMVKGGSRTVYERFVAGPKPPNEIHDGQVGEVIWILTLGTDKRIRSRYRRGSGLSTMRTLRQKYDQCKKRRLNRAQRNRIQVEVRCLEEGIGAEDTGSSHGSPGGLLGKIDKMPYFMNGLPNQGGGFSPLVSKGK